MRRVARPVRVLVVLVLVGAGLVAGASPCFACSCAPSTPAEKLENAEAAFVGRVVETNVDDEGTTQTFEVDGVYEGDLGPTVQVWAQVGGDATNTCAVVFPEGDRLALALSRSGERWTTSICSLVTEAQLTRIAGSPSTSTGQVTPSPTSPPPPSEGGLGTAGDDPMPGWSVPIAGGLIGIAVIWLVLVVANRRERGPTEAARSRGDDEAAEGE